MAPPGLEQSLHPSSPGRGCGGARHPGTTRRPVLSWQSNLLRLTGLEVVEHHLGGTDSKQLRIPPDHPKARREKLRERQAVARDEAHVVWHAQRHPFQPGEHSDENLVTAGDNRGRGLGPRKERRNRCVTVLRRERTLVNWTPRRPGVRRPPGGVPSRAASQATRLAGH